MKNGNNIKGRLNKTQQGVLKKFVLKKIDTQEVYIY
jgi:hypothetical protein